MRTGTGKGKNSREFEAFSRCPRTPGQTPTATELASPHTAGPQTPPITAEFLPVSFPSVLPPSVLRSSLHVSTDCTPRTGALVERLRLQSYRKRQALRFHPLSSIVAGLSRLAPTLRLDFACFEKSRR